MKMLWAVLLILSGLMSVWFLGKGALESWGYYTLGKEAQAQINHWNIQEIHPSKYYLIADYSFTVEGKEYQGKTEFRSFHHLNRFAAEAAVKNIRETTHRVWYKKSNPAISALEKKPPFKSLTYAGITLAVFFYFLYSFKKHSEEDLVNT